MPECARVRSVTEGGAHSRDHVGAPESRRLDDWQAEEAVGHCSFIEKEERPVS